MCSPVLSGETMRHLADTVWKKDSERYEKVIWNHLISVSVSSEKYVFETTIIVSIVVPCFWSLSLSSSHSSPTVRPKPCGSTGSSSKMSSHINHVVLRRSLWYAIGRKLTKSTVFYSQRKLVPMASSMETTSVAWCASYRTGSSHRKQCATQLLAAAVHRNSHAKHEAKNKTYFAGPGRQTYPHEHLGL